MSDFYERSVYLENKILSRRRGSEKEEIHI